MEQNETSPTATRRGFFAKLAALTAGGLALLVPAVSGVMLVLDPLRRKSRAAGLVRVTSLQALPNDGVPRRFNIVTDRVDAWNTHLNVPVGSVYLRRSGEGRVTALQATCPHAGCFVAFSEKDNQFRCPCHNSVFGVDGAREGATSVSPRAMDELAVEIRNGTEVWVRFQNFQTGTSKKVPVA